MLFLALGSGASQAAPAVSGSALGPWLFASVALLLVAFLAWELGRAAGRRQGRHEARRPPSSATSGSASKPSPAPAEPPAHSPSHGSATPPAVAAADEAAAFSYALSHDLQAPLRVVEGFARILKEDYGRQLDRIGNDHLDRLLSASYRMHSMIEGMLALAQLSSQPLSRSPVDMSQMARDIVEELRRTQATREVTVDIAGGLHVMGDPTLLRQMLENLLSNAWKYSSRAQQARISFGLREKAGQTVYEVADNGAGFDMRSANRLFGLFQRLHGQSDFPGTGLGLASVQRIVRRHGGQIWAEAEPGRGARFYFTLPG